MLLEDGHELVCKVGAAGARLDVEAGMLAELERSGWPVPRVLHGGDDLLVMSWVAADGRCGRTGEQAAADLLAARHAVAQPAFGFPVDTLIGGLVQPNPESPRWVPFFAEQRILHRAASGERSAVQKFPSRYGKSLGS